MRCLDTGRLHWGAYCVGVAERLLAMASRRASERHQFGRALREHQEIAFAIADMAASLHAARLVAYEAGLALRPRSQGSTALRRALQAHRSRHGRSRRRPDLADFRGRRRILDGTSEMMRRIVARHALGRADS
jgi:acyl-CoA dehydrogenase